MADDRKQKEDVPILTHPPPPLSSKILFYGLLSMIPYLIVHPELNIHLLFDQPELTWNLLFLGCIASMLCFLAFRYRDTKIFESSYNLLAC